jgi:uncharacterized membrane protein
VVEISAAVARRVAGEFMFNKTRSLLKHLWLDATDAERALPPDMLARLTQRVAASEARHTGEIRIYVEAALPMSYLWRLGSKTSMAQLIRQRAITLFGKLGVWDTQHNNGVLIYLQLAEHAIEIVADRGLHAHVGGAHWQAVVASMSAHFKQGKFEDGLTDALAEVSGLMVAHFPQSGNAFQTNELPDEPILG